jgi:hypothetical protein
MSTTRVVGLWLWGGWKVFEVLGGVGGVEVVAGQGAGTGPPRQLSDGCVRQRGAGYCAVYMCPVSGMFRW